MKKAVFFMIAMFAGLGAYAQQTHHLDWYMNISSADASLTIDVGDTVEWTFTDAAQHSVTSDPGSTETFDSTILPAGSTYSFTFTQEGTNPYRCGVHSSMDGVITVQNLSTEEKSVRNFSIGPNPVSTELFIDLPNQVENLKLSVYDLSGRLVLSQSLEGKRTSTNVSALASGTYLVELSNGEVSKTKRFIKK